MLVKDITGAYVVPLSLFSSDSSNQDIYLICDTSGGPVGITLPEISTLPYLNNRVYVVDGSGNAGTNNITISTSGSDLNNGSTNSVLVSTAFGAVKLQPINVSAWESSIAGTGITQTVKIGTIGFADVNALAAAASVTVTLVGAKPARQYAARYYTKVTTAFVSGGANPIPQLATINEKFSATKTELEFAPLGRTIVGGINAQMQNSEAADINVTLVFAGGGVNPKDYTAGSVDVYADFSPIP